METETTVGTRLDEAASRAREKIVSMLTVAAANPRPARKRTTQQASTLAAGGSVTRGIPTRETRDTDALLSKVSFPHSAAVAPNKPARLASLAACRSR